MKMEGDLKANLVAEIRSQFPGFMVHLHQDVRRHGIADLSVTGLGKTTWWELKHGNPLSRSEGIQELELIKMEAAGRCRYIIWSEHANGGLKRTLIARPLAVHLAEHPRQGHVDTRTIMAEVSFSGFVYRSVALWIGRMHE